MTRPKRRSSKRKTPETAPAEPSSAGSSPRTAIVDIGGTGVKMIVIDSHGEPVTERMRELTPDPATPEAVFELIEKMAKDLPPFDRVSVGFPGVVMHGVAKNAPNLGNELWSGVEIEETLRKSLDRPVRVINDADLQGFGVIRGHGVELVLTLGTGLGSGLYVGGRLVPNLELGHHPFRRTKTYEQRLSDKQLKRIGPKRWSKRVLQAVRQLEALFSYDHLYLGGGNVPHLRAKLPDDVSVFDNVQGMKGGLHLWQDVLPSVAQPEPERASAKRSKPAPKPAAPSPSSNGA
jgi:polyphosphate glucokinase